jgi:hypothetical protein
MSRAAMATKSKTRKRSTKSPKPAAKAKVRAKAKTGAAPRKATKAAAPADPVTEARQVDLLRAWSTTRYSPR